MSQFDDYFSAPGLSFSGMKDLAVSPLRYWHLNINPHRPERKESPEMRFGSALHCAVLQPDLLDTYYACELDREQYEYVLDTMDDLRTWLKDKGITPKGTRKADLIAQAQAVDPDAPILDVLQAQHAEQHAGKVMFNKADWFRLGGAANALRTEPEVQALLSEGRAEAALFATDPNHGVPLKGRVDWLNPEYTVDVKTFSQQRGKSIDRTVTDAIWYEGYYRQAYFYATLRAMQNGGNGRPKEALPFVFAFVESDEPFEVRIKVLRPSIGGYQPNLYWERARVEVNALIATYAEYHERFGERPWRDPRTADPLLDEELTALAYS